MSTPIITSKTGITITLSANSTVLANTPGLNPPNTISNIVILGGKTRFSELVDVVTTGKVDGDTVVYNGASNTYNVQTYNLDSGEF